MLLNCDMGEQLDASIDQTLMPYLDQASIACGLHAGSTDIMRRTLALAKQHGVSVGAHPSYNDRQGFGRRAKHCSIEAIPQLLHGQIDSLNSLATEQGLRLSYVKPHGALYNDMMIDAELRRTIMTAVSEYSAPLALVLQASSHAHLHQQEAEKLGLSLQFEAFVDRCYDDSGALLARALPKAVHDEQNIMQQLEQLLARGAVVSANGKVLPLQVDTLCLHSDNPAAVAMVSKIRARLER